MWLALKSYLESKWQVNRADENEVKTINVSELTGKRTLKYTVRIRKSPSSLYLSAKITFPSKG